MNFANLDFFGLYEVVDADPNGVLTRPAGIIAVKRDGSTAYVCVGGNVWQIVGGILKATRSIEITTETSTSATVWSDLLTLTFTTAVETNAVLIWAGLNAHMSSTGMMAFQIVVDGVPIRAGSVRPSNASAASAGVNIPIRLPITGNASHTVKVRWKVAFGLTATIDPTLDQDFEYFLDFGNLVVAEVAG